MALPALSPSDSVRISGAMLRPSAPRLLDPNAFVDIEPVPFDEVRNRFISFKLSLTASFYIEILWNKHCIFLIEGSYELFGIEPTG